MRQYLLGFGMVLALSACGDPLRDVARLSDVPAAEDAASVAQTPAEARNTGGGLFSRLLNRQPDDPTNAAVKAALANTAAPVVEHDAGVQGATEDVAQAAPETPQRQGLFGGLFRRGPATAAVPRNGPDASDVEAGTVLPLGQIARVCGVSRGDLGRQVDEGGGFKVYDTIPNSTAPRPFYITGFEDDCARTFTGAVVITGDIETHEFVRYQSSNERISYSTTDNAYEALKASVCRVGRGQPCGDRSDRLNTNTHFITVYGFFGGTFSAVPTEWAQILIHDGRVLAMSLKDG